MASGASSMLTASWYCTMRQSTTSGKCRGAVIPYLIPTYKALQKSKNARKIRKTEDVQTPSVSSFGFSIFKAPSMAPSTIGKYCSGQSFNFCPTRWRSSLSSRMTSGLKYLSIGRPQIFTSCMITGRLGSCPRFQCWQDTWYQYSPFRLNLFVQGSSPSVLLLHPHRKFQNRGNLRFLPYCITHIHSIFHSLPVECCDMCLF